MDKTKGLYGKYIITKADGTPVNDRCFILKPDKDPAAVKALQAYAAATEDDQLRHDLYAWVGAPDMVLKPGDKVVMNNRYYVSEANKGKVWTVRTEPWMCCGALVVGLVGKSGGYAVDGLDLVYDTEVQDDD